MRAQVITQSISLATLQKKVSRWLIARRTRKKNCWCSTCHTRQSPPPPRLYTLSPQFISPSLFWHYTTPACSPAERLAHSITTRWDWVQERRWAVMVRRDPFRVRKRRTLWSRVLLWLWRLVPSCPPPSLTGVFRLLRPSSLSVSSRCPELRPRQAYLRRIPRA